MFFSMLQTGPPLMGDTAHCAAELLKTNVRLIFKLISRISKKTDILTCILKHLDRTTFSVRKFRMKFAFKGEPGVRVGRHKIIYRLITIL